MKKREKESKSITESEFLMRSPFSGRADLEQKAPISTRRRTRVRREGTKVKTPRGGVFIRGVTKIGSGRTELCSYAPRPYFRKGKERWCSCAVQASRLVLRTPLALREPPRSNLRSLTRASTDPLRLIICKQNSTEWKKNGVFHPKNKANCEDITKEMLCGNTASLFVCGYAQM